MRLLHFSIQDIAAEKAWEKCKKMQAAAPRTKTATESVMVMVAVMVTGTMMVTVMVTVTAMVVVPATVMAHQLNQNNQWKFVRKH